MDPPIISVCVATFRRPRLLAELLAALSRQDGAPPFEVIVVDNDGDGSAAPILSRARLELPALRLRHFREPVQNIALARNRTVAEARGEWIAFVDDDERPRPRWLAELHAAAGRFEADGVCAPVLPLLAPDAPAWVAAGRFFERPRHPTGTPVPRGELRTSNALLRRSLLVAPTVARPDGAGPFDPRYGLSGGEDTVLFTALVDRGARFVWADAAIVDEWVPPERARLRYVLGRAFGGGHGHARYRLSREGARAVPSLLIRAVLAVGGAALLAPASLPLGRHRAIAWCRVGVTGLGKLAGLTPLHYEPYRAPPPSSAPAPVDAAPAPRYTAGG